ERTGPGSSIFLLASSGSYQGFWSSLPIGRMMPPLASRRARFTKARGEGRPRKNPHSCLSEAGTRQMHGRIVGLIAAGLLTAGVAEAGECRSAGAGGGRARQPVLEVRQSLPEWVARGEAVPIEILITNTGTAVADGVAVSSTLPASVDLMEATPTPERLRG